MTFSKCPGKGAGLKVPCSAAQYSISVSVGDVQYSEFFQDSWWVCTVLAVGVKDLREKVKLFMVLGCFVGVW
ncbi:hypothetical protein H5410_013145 [Solanum commersonii]|uniref:Uncharacterized protein n=1 Tax=Solanum commersonii TaxID=4109 RepID=A0A9J6AUV5_SOLCO|nr:hypothetical protein H5410_013145 [Solanum commersonii]